MSWDIQRAYLAGMDEDESVPFTFAPAATVIPEGPHGPRVRTGVKTDADVIDLTAMIEQMEAGRKPGGGGH